MVQIRIPCHVMIGSWFLEADSKELAPWPHRSVRKLLGSGEGGNTCAKSDWDPREDTNLKPATAKESLRFNPNSNPTKASLRSSSGWAQTWCSKYACRRSCTVQVCCDACGILRICWLHGFHKLRLCWGGKSSDVLWKWFAVTRLFWW